MLLFPTLLKSFEIFPLEFINLPLLIDTACSESTSILFDDEFQIALALYTSVIGCLYENFNNSSLESPFLRVNSQFDFLTNEVYSLFSHSHRLKSFY